MHQTAVSKMGLMGVCSLCLAVFIAGCATVPERHSEDGFSLASVCQQRGVLYDYDPVTQRIKLDKGADRVSAFVGSDEIWLNEEKIKISRPLWIREGQVIAPEDVRNKVLARLVGGVVFFRSGKFLIVLDPGHGGKDPGAMDGHGGQEKTIVLDIVKRLKTELEREGFQVALTRSTDTFLSLEERGELASRMRADLFVSIHVNASEAVRASGVEVWSATPLTSRERETAQWLKNRQIFLKQVAVNTQNRDVERVLEDLMYRYKINESAALANQVSRVLAQDTRVANRGAKDSGFHVLKNTLSPAVLVETGFLTNPREARLLKTPDYRQGIAESLARAIVRYVNSR